MGRRFSLLAYVLAAGLVGCSDDDDRDGGGDLDQRTITPDIGSDRSTRDLSAAEVVKGDTIAFVKALGASLPATPGTSKVERWIPKDNTVPGWVEDGSRGKGIQATRLWSLGLRQYAPGHVQRPHALGVLRVLEGY